MDNINLIAALEGREVRQNLIAIRQQLKSEALWPALRPQVLDHTEQLCGLLGHEDPKVRKNVALILGEAGAQKALEPLCQAYVTENTLFVRPAYLEAMGQLDYRSVMPVIRERLEIIDRMEMAPEEKKHLTQERHLLAELADLAEGGGRHCYCDHASKVILTVKRGREAILHDEIAHKLPTLRPGKMHGGVTVSVRCPSELMQLRTFSKMLFCFCRDNGFEKDAVVLARSVMDAGIMDYLGARHEGGGTWRFRIDIHTRDEAKPKAALAKAMAAELEALGHGQLVNSVSDYEIEFVLMEGRDGRVFVYLRLHTLEDERFAYRKNHVAASMNPVTAAQMIACARPYLVENANVLDPFCGVGTLLLERRLTEPGVRSLYGLDIYGTAIEGGRENARLAGFPVNYIHRDFFDFTHGYLFDEIITDMPDSFQTRAEKEQFYMKFFGKAMTHLSDGGRLFIYCDAPELIAAACVKYPAYSRVFSCLFSERTKTGIFILEFQKNYK